VSLSRDIDALERAADAVKYGLVPDRPHIEVTAPSLHWPALAPAGKHVLTARVHYAPYRLRDEGVWDAARAAALADRVTGAIDAAAPGFAARVLQRTTLSPRDVEQRFGVTEGALSHGELALDQIMFMRPVAGLGRYAMPLDGLYLCGAGTHPGPGVPGGPGWLAARRVLARGRRRPSL
jgi:phytoene dehydrogenase-like protein